MAVELEYESGGRKFYAQERRDQNAAVGMINSRLDKIELAGKWRIRPIEQRNRKGQEIFRAMGVVTEHGGSKIRLWCRPSSAESAWEFDVIFSGGPMSADALQSIIERLRSNELAGHDDAEIYDEELSDLPDNNEVDDEEVDDEEVDDEIDDDEPDEPVVAATPSAPVVAVTPVPVRSAKDLKATLGRLHLILQRAEERESEIVRIRDRLSALTLEQTTATETLNRKLAELSYAESRVQDDLDRLITVDKADKSLLQIEQMLSLAGDIKF